ncbi:MAG: hypothetical protein DRP29_09470 [Thermodesulfobacteriota bacterium]|nr:MAG: hypothetical protein DRP29_09470 [Thermodesulfobacteriota bacterium]
MQSINLFKDKKIDNIIHNFKELEYFLYTLLDNHKDKIEAIIKDIKEHILDKIEKPENKFYITFLICDIVKTYFSDLISQDFLDIEIEELENKNSN